MADFTVKQVGDMEAIFYGSFKRAGAELELSSFGMNVIDFPPDAGEGVYPDHDHAEEGEEEVYLAWRGSGILTVEGEEITLDQDTAVRVGPETKRKVRSGPDGLRLGEVEVGTEPEEGTDGALLAAGHPTLTALRPVAEHEGRLVPDWLAHAERVRA